MECVGKVHQTPAKQRNQPLLCQRGFLGGSDNTESTSNVGALSLIPGSGRSPGEGNGNPLQDFFLENPMDRGA